MRLFCINALPLENAQGGLSMNSKNCVVEGEIYTGKNRRIDNNGDDVWFIEEVQADKQASRFLPCSEEDEETEYHLPECIVHSQKCSRRGEYRKL